jgi:3-oxoadipate CoA-transferase beta subunit
VSPAFTSWRGAKRLALITEHTTRDGKPKLVKRCLKTLTGVGCVTWVYTSLAVIDIEGGHFVLREKLPALSTQDLQALTSAALVVDTPVADLVIPEL